MIFGASDAFSRFVSQVWSNPRESDLLSEPLYRSNLPVTFQPQVTEVTVVLGSELWDPDPKRLYHYALTSCCITATEQWVRTILGQ